MKVHQENIQQNKGMLILNLELSQTKMCLFIYLFILTGSKFVGLQEYKKLIRYGCKGCVKEKLFIFRNHKS